MSELVRARKIFVSNIRPSTSPESNSARVLVGCKPTINFTSITRSYLKLITDDIPGDPRLLFSLTYND